MPFCPSCGASLDPSHRFCPQCGSSAKGDAPPIVIEATGKRWKRLQLLAALLVVVSLVILIGAAAAKDRSVAPLAGFGFLGGFVLFIYARVMAWWHHG